MSCQPNERKRIMGRVDDYRISEQKDGTYKLEYSFRQDNKYTEAVKKPTASTLKEAIQYCASYSYHIVWYESVEETAFKRAVARRIPSASSTLTPLLRKLWNEGITYGRKNPCCSSEDNAEQLCRCDHQYHAKNECIGLITGEDKRCRCPDGR